MNISQLDNYSSQRIGLFQALGIMTYITVLTGSINLIGGAYGDVQPPVMLSMMLFLLVFVVSAVITGSLGLGYATILIFRKELRRAVEVVTWTAVWLVLITLGVAMLAITFARPGIN